MTFDKSGVMFGERLGGFVVVLFRVFGMGMRQVAEWQNRAREACETSFDHRAALSLTKEIRASNARGLVSHRASQVIYLLEHVTDSGNNSSLVVNAQSAFMALQRALGGIGEQRGAKCASAAT